VNIYTASKFENADFVRNFNNAVRDLGHNVTYDWTSTREFLEDGTVLKASPEDRYTYGMLDYAGVMACDLLIMIDFETPLRGGAWEAGMALGAGKQVWIVNYQHRVIFDVLPQVKIISDPNVALSLLDTRYAVA
jgi:hypothetical protein